MKIDYIFAHNTIGCFYFLLYCFKISYSIAPISSFSNRLYNSNKIIIQMQIKIFNTFFVCVCACVCVRTNITKQNEKS